MQFESSCNERALEVQSLHQLCHPCLDMLDYYGKFNRAKIEFGSADEVSDSTLVYHHGMDIHIQCTGISERGLPYAQIGCPPLQPYLLAGIADCGMLPVPNGP